MKNDSPTMTPSSADSIPKLLLDGVRAYTSTYRDSEIAPLSVLYIDIVGFSRFEQSHGLQACNDVLGTVSNTLLELLSQHALPWQNSKVLHIWDDGFAILIPHAALGIEETRIIHGFVLRAEEVANQRIRFSGYPALRLRYGLSQSLSSDNQTLNDRLYQQITAAGRIARRYHDTIPLFLVDELRHIIESRNITSYYQPIMHIQTRTAIGWESLTRGPHGSDLESPVNLFGCAERLGYLLDMERVCRNQSIRRAKLGPDSKLFLNLSPNILSDPSFRQGETRKIIQEVGLEPEQIVFEITEHKVIDDYTAFLNLVTHYRNQGYQIAIDDVGAGYSGLVTLMQVKPDFVKIDMELVRGIDKDSTKRDIVRAIRDISTGFSGTVIAEGIETPEELECVQGCGIQYGQGFLLGVPKPSILEDLRKTHC